VIERKYLDMFERLKKELPPEGGSSGEKARGGNSGIEPLPGWFARRRKDLPPSRDVLERIPRGSAA
jgi:hypothetical protein